MIHSFSLVKLALPLHINKIQSCLFSIGIYVTKNDSEMLHLLQENKLLHITF